MKRGVGIKFQCQFLSPDKLRQWLFDNVGESKMRLSDDSVIVTDNEWYYTFSETAQILRIALWTDAGPDEAYTRIQQMAKRVAVACQCNLTTYATDLYEYDETAKAHVLKYDALVGGEVNTTIVKPEVLEASPTKPVRWN